MFKYKSILITLLLCINTDLKVAAQAADKADSLYNAGREAHTDVRLNESRELYYQAMEIYVSLNDTLNWAKTLTGLVSVHWRLGKYGEAQELAGTGIRLAEFLNDVKKVSMFLTDMGTIKSRQGYYDEAHRYFTEALELANQINDPESISLILNNFANLNRRMGNVHESIRQFEHSLELLEETDDTLGQAITLNSLGVSYLNAGKINQALQRFEQSLQLRLEGETTGDLAIMYNNLAMTHRQLGNNLLVLDYFDKSLQIHRENDNKYGSASTLRNIGFIHFQQNDLDRAEYYFLKSHEIYSEFDDTANLSSTFNALGRLYIRKKEYEKALGYFNQRLKLDKKVGNPRSAGYAYSDIGYYYKSVKNYEKALTYYRKAYEVSSPIESKSQLVNLLTDIGTTLSHMKSYEDALDYLNRALSIANNINPDIPDPNILMELAALHHQMESDSSYYYAEMLYESIEKQRVQIGAAGRAKANFFSSFAPFYNQVASWYLDEMDDLDMAYRWVESAKARAFIDDLAEATHNLDAQLDSKDLNEKISRSNRIIELSSQLEMSNEDNREDLLQKLREAELQYDAFLSRLRLTNPAYSLFDYPDPITLQDAKNKCDKNTVILEYSFSESKLVSFAISQNSAKGWLMKNPVIDGDDNPYISELIIQFREAIINKRPVNEINELSEVLAHILISPARQMLKDADQLIIVTEGMLAYLPFEALVWENEYFIEKYQIKYAPSITALSLIRDPQPEYDLDLLKVANPKFGGEEINPSNFSFPSLPYSTLEAKAISPLFNNVTLLTGKDATGHRLKTEDLTRYKYLHFATHGFLNEKSPELSGLVLARSEDNFKLFSQDVGFLRSAEIYALSIHADLVVLSACETGLGKEVRGEGILGLQRAFLHAGASTVVVSLWPVYDHSTSLLMTMFYEELIKHDELWNNFPSKFRRWIGWDAYKYGYKAAAMRNAKLALIDNPDYDHPVYWAPFIVVGK